MTAWKKACWQNFRPFINLNTAIMIIFTKLKGECATSIRDKGEVRVWESFSGHMKKLLCPWPSTLNNYKPSQTTVCNYDETKACIPLIHFAKLQQPPHRRPQLAKQPNKVVLWKNARETVNRHSVMRHMLQNITGWHRKAKLLQHTCMECKIIGQWIHHGPNRELSSLRGSNHRFFDLKMSHNVIYSYIMSRIINVLTLRISNKNYE